MDGRGNILGLHGNEQPPVKLAEHMAGTVARQSICIFHGWVGFGLGLVLLRFNDDRCLSYPSILLNKETSKQTNQSAARRTNNRLVYRPNAPADLSSLSLSGAWTCGAADSKIRPGQDNDSSAAAGRSAGRN
jgi:hypothetical protein